jgi:hypothetical protein
MCRAPLRIFGTREDKIMHFFHIKSVPLNAHCKNNILDKLWFLETLSTVEGAFYLAVEVLVSYFSFVKNTHWIEHQKGGLYQMENQRGVPLSKWNWIQLNLRLCFYKWLKCTL